MVHYSGGQTARFQFFLPRVSGSAAETTGVDQALASGRRRLRKHPADGLPGDPEPDLTAVGFEFGPEPETTVRLPGGVAGRQGPCAARPVLAPASDDDLQIRRRSSPDYSTTTDIGNVDRAEPVRTRLLPGARIRLRGCNPGVSLTQLNRAAGVNGESSADQ